jgi:hypothetical protein
VAGAGGRAVDATASASSPPALTSAPPTVVRVDRMMFIVSYALLVGLVGVALVYLGARP